MTGGATSGRIRERHLNVKPEQDRVAVLDGVVASFLTHLAGLFRAGFAATGDVIVK